MTLEKHKILDKKDYTIYFEYIDDFIVGHCDVYRTSPSVMKKIVFDAHVLASIQEKPIYVCETPEEKTKSKFHRALGFSEYLGEYEIADGSIKSVYKWKGSYNG